MSEQAPPTPSGPAALRQVEAFLRVLRFYSRLPVPVFRFERAPHDLPDFDHAAPAVPLAGFLVGLCGALAGGLAYLFGLSTPIAATLSVATLVIVTGALHEDGLADTADGMFGGQTPERRISIMRDSRIGTFGACALALFFLLRVFALADLFRLAGPAALPLLAGVCALARPLGLLPALIFPPAHAEGLGASVPMPSQPRAILALCLGLCLALLCAWPAEMLPGILVALVAALMLVYGIARLAMAKIGGYTGDILGASTLAAETMILVTLSAAAGWHGPI